MNKSETSKTTTPTTPTTPAAEIPRPDALDTPAGLASFVSARVAYLENHPYSRKDRIDSNVAKALNSRKAPPPAGALFWTGPDVASVRRRAAK